MPNKPERRLPDWAALALVEIILATPIGLTAGVAIWELVKTGAVSQTAERWIWLSLLSAIPMILVAAIYAETREK